MVRALSQALALLLSGWQLAAAEQDAPRRVPSLRGRALAAARWDLPFAPTSTHGVLDRHNHYRLKHGSPPLSWDSSLAASAEAWAKNCLDEDSGSFHGENVYNFSLPFDESDAVDAWYEEVSTYDYVHQVGRDYDDWRHFTQVIWAGSQRVGCASATCDAGGIFVCHYDPPGNVWHQYVDNVRPVVSGGDSDGDDSDDGTGGDGGGSAGDAPCTVEMYPECDYGGAVSIMTCEDECRGGMEWLRENTPWQNDAVSSIKVSKGCKAILWRDGDWSGRKVIIVGQDVPCLRSMGFDDDMSSITIIKLPVGVPAILP